MDFLYFLVTSHDAWTNDAYGFHAHYFSDLNTFTYSLLAMVAVGAVLSVAFYMGCCNGKSNALATRTNWWIMFAVTAVVAFCVSHFVFFGGESSGFLAASDSFLNTELYQQYMNNQSEFDKCANELANIKDAVANWNDVALMFSVTNLVIVLVIHFLTSMGVKRFTVHGSQIPF